MFKRITILFMFLIMLLPIGTVVAKSKDVVGEQINILSGEPTTFPSQTAFHIQHGFLLELGKNGPPGVYDFELYVDGVLYQADFAVRSVQTTPDRWFNIVWIYNFPEGMEGEHTFEGRWYGPCIHVVMDPTTCASPNERTLSEDKTLTVSFTT